MTNEEFKQSLTTPKTFKTTDEEKEFLHEVVKYWITNHSPALHLTVQLSNTKLLEIGWLKDIKLIEGGAQELKLLRHAFDSIKKSTIFAD